MSVCQSPNNVPNLCCHHGAFWGAECPSCIRENFFKTKQETITIKKALWDEMCKNQKRTLGYGLTVREEDVLFLMLQGKSNKVMAIELHLALKTIEAHRSTIYKKFGVRSNIDLFIKCVEAQIIECPCKKDHA
jgi:DNA-binding NarL/FixJ family response regulator